MYAHPLASYSRRSMSGMGLSLSELWSGVQESAQTEINKQIQQLPSELAAAAAKELASNPDVQAVAQQQAAQATAEAAVSQLQLLRNQLASTQAKLSQTIPGGLWTVGAVGLIGLVFLLRR